jgi:hypothetical protein
LSRQQANPSEKAVPVATDDPRRPCYSEVPSFLHGRPQNYSNHETRDFQFLFVNHHVGLNANRLHVGLEVHGIQRDISYLAIPTVKYGENILVNDLGQDVNELLRADTHWNPDFSVPFSGTSPPEQLVRGSGLHGWGNLDLEALSLCQCHSSQVNADRTHDAVADAHFLCRCS